MKTIPKWTKADAKRAEKMGWYLRQGWLLDFKHLNNRIAMISDGPFKSDSEAIEWVMDNVISVGYYFQNHNDNYKTCRKALFLCAKGGN